MKFDLTKIKKFSVIAPVVFLFLCICAAVFLLVPKKSDFLLKIEGNEPEKTGFHSKSDTKFWNFTEEQKNGVKNYIEQNGNGALLIEISVLKQNEGRSSSFIGFLYDSDFEKKLSAENDFSSRPLVEADFSQFVKETFRIQYSFSRGGEIPAGFFVISPAKYTVNSAEIVPAADGFDFSEEIPLYAFSANGGFVKKNLKSADFSGVSLSLPATNSDYEFMPEICIKTKKNPQKNTPDTENKENTENSSPETAPDAAPPENLWTSISVNAGGEKLFIRLLEGSEAIIQTSSLKSPFSEFEITENEENVVSVMTRPSSEKRTKFSKNIKAPLTPLTVDPGLIINWQQKNWRSKLYELFAWNRFPEILIFDFANYKIQDDFLLRLAYFTEKKGYKGRLLSDSELSGKHGYNAHDYSAEGLAHFFNAAAEEKFPLNRYELLLREILLENSIILETEGGKFTPGKGAVISVAREIPSYNRTPLLTHECWHGIYFTDEEFRNVSASIFYTMEERTLDFLIKYFVTYPSLSYDVNDEELMKNEFMAYMLQRPVSSAAQYFVNIANWNTVQKNMKEEADYIISVKGEPFTSAAALFDEYVNSRWNLNAGRIGLISR